MVFIQELVCTLTHNTIHATCSSSCQCVCASQWPVLCCAVLHLPDFFQSFFELASANMDREPPFVVSGACTSWFYCLLIMIQYLVQFFPPQWYLDGGIFAVIVTILLTLMGFKPARGVWEIHAWLNNLWNVKYLIGIHRPARLWRIQNEEQEEKQEEKQKE